MRYVQRGQIHQLKRAELEAGLVAQNAVNRHKIGHALRHNPQRLGAKTAPRVVDDEARRVSGLHRFVPHLNGVIG